MTPIMVPIRISPHRVCAVLRVVVRRAGGRVCGCLHVLEALKNDIFWYYQLYS